MRTEVDVCLETTAGQLCLRIGDMHMKLQENLPNKKVMAVLARELHWRETDKPVFTFQTISEGIGHPDRQYSDNIHKTFLARGENFQQLLDRQNTLKAQSFEQVEAQMLEAPYVSIPEQYRLFRQQHPQVSLSEKTFRQYVDEIPSCKLLKRCQQVVTCEESVVLLNSRVYVKELLEHARFTPVKKKEIVTLFPECAASLETTEKSTSQSPSQMKSASPPVSPPMSDPNTPAPPTARKQSMCSPPHNVPNMAPRSRSTEANIDVSAPQFRKYFLVLLLYVCNVPQEVLALLCDVSKTSIHNWIYEVASEQLEQTILLAITCWSGMVSFDEKWLWINEQWMFALCAVDARTGFPLLIALYPTLDAVCWRVFFERFKALYGRPHQILCDGSGALAAARRIVFRGVPYQLCKFHKLKNLFKHLRKRIHDSQKLWRYRQLAKRIFSNTWVSSRKAAAKRLQKLAGGAISSYIEGHILTPWRHLSKSETNNASERFNRKLNKCFFGRYGIPSVESAAVLLRGVWLKELLLNGQKHLDATSELASLDLSRTCHEYLDTSKILHFFHERRQSELEKSA